MARPDCEPPQEISLVTDYYKGDPDGGYRAFVFTDFATSEELVEWSKNQMAAYKYPREIRFMAELPKGIPVEIEMILEVD